MRGNYIAYTLEYQSQVRIFHKRDFNGMENKIIFFASCPHSLINFRLALMQEFVKRNFKVIAIAPDDPDIAQTLRNHHIQFIPCELARNGRNPIHDIIFFIKLFLLIRKQNAQYIFSYTIKPVIYGSLAAKLAGIPNIYSMITGTGYAFSNRNKLSRLIGWIAKQLFSFTLRFNRKIFFQNPDNAAFFIKHKMIASKDKIVIVNGSGVDTSHFYYAKPPNEISFLMIARLLYDKGVREYVEAAKKIKKEFPHISFRLAGWIDSNPNAIKPDELSLWQKAGIIEYLGKLEDVRDSLTNASVYVLPSYAEGTPRTVLEAMSMGRPIITTQAPGCKETVVHGENGFLIPVRDSESLYNTIKHFIQQGYDYLEQMGLKSRKIAVEKYEVTKVNAHMLNEMLVGRVT